MRVLFFSETQPLPVHYRTIVRVVAFLILPIVADFVFHRFFIEFNSQARPGWQVNISITNLERIFDVAIAQADLLLAEEVRD